MIFFRSLSAESLNRADDDHLMFLSFEVFVSLISSYSFVSQFSITQWIHICIHQRLVRVRVEQTMGADAVDIPQKCVHISSSTLRYAPYMLRTSIQQRCYVLLGLSTSLRPLTSPLDSQFPRWEFIHLPQCNRRRLRRRCHKLQFYLCPYVVAQCNARAKSFAWKFIFNNSICSNLFAMPFAQFIHSVSCTKCIRTHHAASGIDAVIFMNDRVQSPRWSGVRDATRIKKRWHWWQSSRCRHRRLSNGLD